MAESMRILFVYPGHRLSTYDIAVGYEKALKALGHEVRTFQYHVHIEFFERALQYHVKELGWNRRADDWRILASEQLIIEAVDFVPDVVLVVSGLALHRRAYDLLAQMQLPVVVIMTESPYADDEQKAMLDLGHVRGALTNDVISAEPLAKQSRLPIAYLPHSYDPETHHPGTEEVGYHSDVFFYGTWWPERYALFSPLVERSNGYNYCIDGVKLRQEGGHGQISIVENKNMARYYRGAKIALNHHRAGDAYSLGPRAYEIAACGAFQLSDYRPELDDLFGTSVSVYSNPVDLQQKIHYYLEHDDERHEMALESLERVKDCTFEQRARQIVIPFIEEVV